jgi:hypothetical protein
MAGGPVVDISTFLQGLKDNPESAPGLPEVFAVESRLWGPMGDTPELSTFIPENHPPFNTSQNVSNSNSSGKACSEEVGS